jgi:hypothetical protein
MIKTDFFPVDRLLVGAAVQGARVLKRLLPPDKASYAPYCGLVARRRLD